jgi:hypothetical protein
MYHTILSYGIESRADTTQTAKIVKRRKMQALRAISGYTLVDRMGNKDKSSACQI